MNPYWDDENYTPSNFSSRSNLWKDEKIIGYDESNETKIKQSNSSSQSNLWKDEKIIVYDESNETKIKRSNFYLSVKTKSIPTKNKIFIDDPIKLKLENMRKEKESNCQNVSN